MDRINGADTHNIGQGRRGFKDENVVAGSAGTEVTAAFLNSVQEEVIKVIEEAGLELDVNDWTQLFQAISKMIDEKFSNIQDNDTFLSEENVQDIVANFLQGQNVGFTYNDEGDALNINVAPATVDAMGLVEKATLDETLEGEANKYPDASSINEGYLKRHIKYPATVTNSNQINYVPIIDKAGGFFNNASGIIAVELDLSAISGNSVISFDITVNDRNKEPITYTIGGGFVLPNGNNWIDGSVSSTNPDKQELVRINVGGVSDGKYYIYIGEPDSPRSNCNVYITNLKVGLSTPDKAWLDAFKVSIVQETIGFTHKRVEPRNNSGDELHSFEGLGPHTIPRLPVGTYLIEAGWIPIPYAGEDETTQRTYVTKGQAGVPDTAQRPHLIVNQAEGSDTDDGIISLHAKDEILLMVSYLPNNSDGSPYHTRYVYSFRRMTSAINGTGGRVNSSVYETVKPIKESDPDQGVITFVFPDTSIQLQNDHSGIVPESAYVKIKQLV